MASQGLRRRRQRWRWGGSARTCLAATKGYSSDNHGHLAPSGRPRGPSPGDAALGPRHPRRRPLYRRPAAGAPPVGAREIHPRRRFSWCPSPPWRRQSHSMCTWTVMRCPHTSRGAACKAHTRGLRREATFCSSDTVHLPWQQRGERRNRPRISAASWRARPPPPSRSAPAGSARVAHTTTTLGYHHRAPPAP